MVMVGGEWPRGAHLHRSLLHCGAMWLIIRLIMGALHVLSLWALGLCSGLCRPEYRCGASGEGMWNVLMVGLVVNHVDLLCVY